MRFRRPTKRARSIRSSPLSSIAGTRVGMATQCCTCRCAASCASTRALDCDTRATASSQQLRMASREASPLSYSSIATPSFRMVLHRCPSCSRPLRVSHFQPTRAAAAPRRSEHCRQSTFARLLPHRHPSFLRRSRHHLRLSSWTTRRGSAVAIQLMIAIGLLHMTLVVPSTTARKSGTAYIAL